MGRLKIERALPRRAPWRATRGFRDVAAGFVEPGTETPFAFVDVMERDEVAERVVAAIALVAVLARDVGTRGREARVEVRQRGCDGLGGDIDHAIDTDLRDRAGAARVRCTRGLEDEHAQTLDAVVLGIGIALARAQLVAQRVDAFLREQQVDAELHRIADEEQVVRLQRRRRRIPVEILHPVSMVGDGARAV